MRINDFIIIIIIIIITIIIWDSSKRVLPRSELFIAML